MTAALTAESAADFLERWTGHANRGEWTQFAALLHPDVTIVDPMSPDPAVGSAAALERVQSQYAPFDAGAVHTLKGPLVSAESPDFAYYWRFTGKHTRPVDPPGFAPTNVDLDFQGVSVLTVVDDRAIEVRLFFDTTDVARQLGAAPPAGGLVERGTVLAQRLRAPLLRRRR